MTLDRDWERFRGGPRRPPRDRMHVTLNKRGQIYFNANAHRVLGRPEAVHLYFNRKKDSIAVAPASSIHLSDAFPVRERMPRSFVIHASTFCQNYGIKVTATQEFFNADVNNEGVLLLDLSNTMTVTRPRGPNKPKT